MRLILMRHAKSGWDDPLLPDHERPLAPRGIDAAGRIGRWLVDNGHIPDVALVSSARRTVETWERLGLECPSTKVPGLYLAAPEMMLRVLQGASGNTVLMIGHNPGIAEFARMILRTSPPHARFHDFPTAATLVAEFSEGNWRDIRFGQALAMAFVVPRELDAAG
jgi:phosphohistidine phosphatase